MSARASVNATLSTLMAIAKVVLGVHGDLFRSCIHFH
jgi:hypothetical protein